MNTLFGKDPASDLSSHRKVGEGLKLITDFQELEGFGHYTDTLVAWKMALQGSKVVIKATSSEKVCLFGLFFHCFQSQTQIAVLFYKYNDVTKKFAAWFTDVVDLDEEGACLKHSKRIAALEVLEVLGRDPEMIDYRDDQSWCLFSIGKQPTRSCIASLATTRPLKTTPTKSLDTAS